MVTLRILSAYDREALRFIQALYKQSFPLHEQRDWSTVVSLISNKCMQLHLIKDDETNVGFIIQWQLENVLFIEHFAIEPAFQSKGLGTKVFNKVLSASAKQVIIETELPDTIIAKRRVAFYERRGLKKVPFAYMQPPYRAGDNFFPMQLMSKFVIDDSEAFNMLKRELYEQVYCSTNEK